RKDAAVVSNNAATAAANWRAKNTLAPIPDGSPIIMRKLWLNDGESARRPGDGLAPYAFATMREFVFLLAPARQGKHPATGFSFQRCGTANNDAYAHAPRCDAVPIRATAAEGRLS